jgi:hypothetical protein
MDSPAPKPGPLRTDPAGLSQPAASDPEAPAPRQRSSIGWRIALFVWMTAFGFLAAYELILTLFKTLKLR